MKLHERVRLGVQFDVPGVQGLDAWMTISPLRFTAGVGVGISGACGPPLVGSLIAPPMDASFSSLFYFFALSACACRFEVTVTSVSLPPFMSHRCLFNTNQRHTLSLCDLV